MKINMVVREELKKVDEKLNAAYTEVGEAAVRLGTSSRTYSDATTRAEVLKKRHDELILVLEVIESNWVTKRAAEAS